MDNPSKRSDNAKLCMSPSLDGTRPEYVISQEKTPLMEFFLGKLLIKPSNIEDILISSTSKKPDC